MRKINQALALCLVSALSTACAPVGKNAVAQGSLAAAASVTSALSSLEVAQFDTNQDIRLELASTSTTGSSSNDLAFIDHVATSQSVISGGKLKLSLFDDSGAKISIPSSFLSNSRYKATAEYIVIRLSNGSSSTSLVIHRGTGKTFITRDTNLKEILLATTPSSVVVQVNGRNRPGLRMSAVKTDGTTVNVAITYADGAMYAVKI